MKEILISYQFHVLDWLIYVQFDHTFPCCIVVKRGETVIFQSMLEISASNFIVAYVKKQASIK